jgi:glycosyltransferase involved in cell wall biosynthesis
VASRSQAKPPHIAIDTPPLQQSHVSAANVRTRSTSRKTSAVVRLRVAHLVSHPIQYFAPLYRALAARPEIDLTVYFCSDATLREFYDAEFGRRIAWDSDLVSGYEWRVVASARGRPLSAVRRRVQPDLLRALVVGRYDAIWVHGYAYPSAWLAALAAAVSRAKLLIREEQTLLHSRPLAKRAVKRLLLGLLFRRAVGLYIGQENRRYFRYYGIEEGSLFHTPYSVDNVELQRRAAELAPQRDALRARLGIENEAPIVLFVGKLIEAKQPRLLLDAFARVTARTPCWLVMAGDGPLSDEIQRAVSARGLSTVIRPGFVNQSALPEVYAAADVFVLPSAHETWGLVVNEALNFSLPVVVTDKVGCAADLVEEGQNGFVVPADDAEALARRLGELVEDPALRGRFGQHGRKLVERYGIDQAADGIVNACLGRRVRA